MLSWGGGKPPPQTSPLHKTTDFDGKTNLGGLLHNRPFFYLFFFFFVLPVMVNKHEYNTITNRILSKIVVRPTVCF